MREQTSVASQQLYQSQWWTRLAAFTENSDRLEMSDTLQFVVIPREEPLAGDKRQTKVCRTFILSSVAARLRSMFFVRGLSPIKNEGFINSLR